MPQLSLSAQKRGPESLGRLRSQGKVPGIVYGHSDKAIAVALDAKEFQRVLSHAGRTHLIDLTVEGSKATKVIIREVQHNPRHIGPIHVDFYRVSMKDKLQAEVPVVTVGESPAIKTGVGELLHVVHTLKIECLPGDLPEALQLDLSRLVKLDDAIRLGHLKLPKITILGDPDEVLVKVTGHKAPVEEELPVAAVAEVPEVGETETPSEAGEES